MKSLDSIIFKYSLAMLCAAFAGGCGEEGGRFDRIQFYRDISGKS